MPDFIPQAGFAVYRGPTAGTPLVPFVVARIFTLGGLLLLLLPKPGKD